MDVCRFPFVWKCASSSWVAWRTGWQSPSVLRPFLCAMTHRRYPRIHLLKGKAKFSSRDSKFLSVDCSRRVRRARVRSPLAPRGPVMLLGVGSWTRHAHCTSHSSHDTKHVCFLHSIHPSHSCTSILVLASIVVHIHLHLWCHWLPS